MLEILIVSASIATAFTLGGFAITQAGRHADHIAAILTSAAVGGGMLALIGGLARLDAQGPTLSQAEARPVYGMD